MKTQAILSKKAKRHLQPDNPNKRVNSTGVKTGTHPYPSADGYISVLDSIANNPKSNTVQLEKVIPTYSGSGHSTEVKLKMDKGDTIGSGSPPKADINGWTEIRHLGLTTGDDDDHRWVKFHVLNEKAGGSGDEAGNLTPATQTANHHTDWNKFEKKVKTYIDPEHKYGLGAPENIEFSAKVEYYGSSENGLWKKNNSQSAFAIAGGNYPKKITAELITEENYYDAILNSDKGLKKPSEFDPPGWNWVS